MSIYLDKLAQLQVVINCRYSFAQMGNWKDTRSPTPLHKCTPGKTYTHAILDNVMSQRELTTMLKN